MSRSKLADFEILTRLGSGSFGTVYKVRRLIDESLYVIKNVRIVELTYKEQSEAINEVQILAQLKSPYVVRYYDSFIEKECLHIVMEYCNRGDLQVLIKKAKEKNVTCLKEDVIWNIALQVILGLHYLHKRHILHRDLKAANVFLMKDPNFTNYLVKIGDLGVAKQMDTSTALANTIVGTPYYLSPELCADMPYKDKSDCWAFGVLLYQCCTLNHPFEARNQCALIMKIIEAQVKPPSSSNISAELTNLIMWVLQKDPQLRPSMKDILCEEFIRGKLVTHNFELPQELEEFSTTSFLNSKTPPAPSMSVLDTESAMLKEKMNSFHRKVNSDNATVMSGHSKSQARVAAAEGSAAAATTAGGSANIGLPPPKRVGSMRSTVSGSTGSEKNGVTGNRVRPGAKRTTSVKALTIHQVKPPPSSTTTTAAAAGASPGGVVGSASPGGTALGSTPRKNSTPRVTISSPSTHNEVSGNNDDDAKSVPEPVVDTHSQDKATPLIVSSSTSELKIGSNSNLLRRQQSKSNKEIAIDTSDDYLQPEYKAEAKETIVKKLSRPTGGASRNGSYKDIPDAPIEYRGSMSALDAKRLPLDSAAGGAGLSVAVAGEDQISPPSEQPSTSVSNYDEEAFEEYESGGEGSPSNAKTQNRQRYPEHKLGGDVEELIDVLKSPFVTMGPLKSFRTAPVEEKTFTIPVTPSHGQEIDQMFYSESTAALKYEQTMQQQQQQLNISQWSPGAWTSRSNGKGGESSNGNTLNKSGGATGGGGDGRRSADVTFRRTEPQDHVGIANVPSADELDAEDAALFAHGLSSDDDEHHSAGHHHSHGHGKGGIAGVIGGGPGDGRDSDEDLNSVDGNEEDEEDEEYEDEEVDEETAEIIEQATESQLKSLSDLIKDSKARSIARFGADLFGKIYELCSRHMGISDGKGETQETTMGPRGSSFMKDLERYVLESGKGIEIAKEAVMGIKVLLALESKYEEVLETNNMMHAPRK